MTDNPMTFGLPKNIFVLLASVAVFGLVIMWVGSINNTPMTSYAGVAMTSTGAALIYTIPMIAQSSEKGRPAND
jgi:hypothetical protein